MDESQRAIDAVAASGLPYRVVEYGEVASLEEAAAKRNIDVPRLLKTMVVRVADGVFVLVLVPGDRVIDWAKLRRHLDTRRLAMADAADALEATGYVHGAITPFGAGDWPVIVDAAVPARGEVSLGGGRRGTAIHLDAADLRSIVGGSSGDVTKPSSGYV